MMTTIIKPEPIQRRSQSDPVHWLDVAADQALDSTSRRREGLSVSFSAETRSIASSPSSIQSSPEKKTTRLDLVVGLNSEIRHQVAAATAASKPVECADPSDSPFWIRCITLQDLDDPEFRNDPECDNHYALKQEHEYYPPRSSRQQQPIVRTTTTSSRQSSTDEVHMMAGWEALLGQMS